MKTGGLGHGTAVDGRVDAVVEFIHCKCDAVGLCQASIASAPTGPAVAAGVNNIRTILLCARSSWCSSKQSRTVRRRH